MRGITYLICVLLFCPGMPSNALEFTRDSAAPTELTVTAAGKGPIDDYVIEVLKMALEVTAPTYGPVILMAADSPALQSNPLRDLERGQLDITWSVTSKQREKRHRAIYFPLLNGLLGKRILVVSKDARRFAHPLSEQSLKSIRLVLEHAGPEASIFRTNGYNIIESSYDKALVMLTERSVDAFPRGIHKIPQELAVYSSRNLKIESTLSFTYPSALFFFVSKENNLLALRLEDGLKILYAQEKFQHHLNAQIFYQQALKALKNRSAYKLLNPLLSEEATQALSTYTYPLSSSF